MPSVYIAEDSPTVSAILQRLLEGAPDLTLAGVGLDGLQAREDIERLRPDILVTDLLMPGLDGYGLIKWVMATRPIPIVVLSESILAGGTENALRCLELGAMEARAKPRVGTPQEFAASRESFQGLLRALAKVKPITRNPSPGLDKLPTFPSLAPGMTPEFLLMGASTGGPQVVLEILKKLGPGFPLPVLLALHMEAGFMEGLGRWLAESTGWTVCQMPTKGPPLPGTLYLPSEGRHLMLDGEGRVQSAPANPGERMIPSVDRLFLSAAPLGKRLVALLLTGMGRDGAAGLQAIRKTGGLTVAQNEASCVVYGMPRAAVEIQATAACLSPEGMVNLLRTLVPDPREETMKLLVADDSPTSRFTVCRVVKDMGFEVEEACDGTEALGILMGPAAPSIAILDWLMPGLDGPDVCEAIRKQGSVVEPYLLLLTSKCSKEDLVEGLGKGADEFLMKPFMEEELRARLRVAERIILLQQSLLERVQALEHAMGHIKTLQGFIPICMYCHKIRQSNQDWQALEDYLKEHADITLSHGLCPDCRGRFLQV